VLRVSLLILCLLGGCAARQLGHGAPSWRLVTTEHFKVYTDLPAERAVARAEDFERWLAAFQQHGWTITGRLALQLNVVLFSDPYEYATYGGRDALGYHVPSVLFEPWVVMPAGREDDDGILVIFRHELAHYIAHSGMYRQPAWFSEGIACYFETAHFDESGDFAVGRPPRWRAQWLDQHRRLSVRQVFAPDADSDATGFYETSWLIVHYLVSEHPDEFEAYQLGLAKGLGHEAAWASAFPKLSVDQLEQQVSAYWRADAFAKWTAEVHAPAGHARTRTLTSADEHALRGILSIHCPGCSTKNRWRRVEEAFRAALAADATQPQAGAWLLMNTQLSREQAMNRGGELTRAHPDDGVAWTVRGLVALKHRELAGFAPDDDPVRALQRIAPDYPYTHLLAAYQHAQRGDREKAIRESKQAQRISKANPHLLWMQAELFAGLSACDDLHDTVQTLVNLGHGEAPDANERAQLAKLEDGCGSH
jgi:hypothetical protein